MTLYGVTTHLSNDIIDVCDNLHNTLKSYHIVCTNTPVKSPYRCVYLFTQCSVKLLHSV